MAHCNALLQNLASKSAAQSARRPTPSAPSVLMALQMSAPKAGHKSSTFSGQALALSAGRRGGGARDRACALQVLTLIFVVLIAI